MKFPQVIYIEQDYEENLITSCGHVFENLKNMTDIDLKMGQKVVLCSRKDSLSSIKTYYLMASVYETLNPLNIFEQAELLYEKIMQKNPNLIETKAFKNIAKQMEFTPKEFLAFREKRRLENQVELTEKFNKIKMI